MIAVDTNIIVRLIVADDEAQVRRAMAMAERELFFVSFTVLIETDWVLRSRYGYDRRGVLGALSSLADLIGVRYQDEQDVRWAFDRYEKGGELADYIHLASARGIGRFATFESKLAERAGDRSPAVVEMP